jgi:hypothetical protein
VAAVLTALIVLAPRAEAATFTVTNLSDSGQGTLRWAIQQANAAAGPDTIAFAFGGTITLTSGQLTVTDDVTIDGGSAADVTISGNQSSRIFWVSGEPFRGTLDLRNVTLVNGLVGGGLAAGGGILNEGTLSVTRTVFAGNSATLYDGGGIHNSGTLTVTDSTFLGNSAGDWGGAISSYYKGVAGSATLTVTNSTFSGNSAADGAGIFNDHTGTLTNSTFSGNSATGPGGGIRNVGALTVTNSTISGNTAGSGDGISTGAGTTTLRNTIVAGNGAGENCDGPIVDGGRNQQHPGTTCGATVASGDPLLDPLGLQSNGGPTQTIALLPGSPAIDTAVAINCPPTDQRGVARPQGVSCDRGAYEANDLIFADDFEP